MSVQAASKATATVTAATIDTVSASGIDTWAGYHVAIVSGTGAGQGRFAPSSPATNQLDVSQDWDIIPDVTSVIHQAENQADWDINFGNKFKLLLKATEEWDGGDFYDIGNGVNNVVAGMFGQGISLDNYIRVYIGSYFSMGALFGEVSLGGWYLDSNNSNATLGYVFLQVDSGAYCYLHNVNLGTVFAHRPDFQLGSNVWLYDVSFANLIYSGANLLGTTLGRNAKFQGKGNINDFVNINTGINGFEGPFIMSNSYGLKPVGTGQTIIMNKYESAIPIRDMEALGSNIFKFQSSKFGGPTGLPITLWTDNTGASGWDIESKLDVNVKAGATNIQNARFVIVEGTTVKTLVNRGDTDIDGNLSDFILKYRARTSAAVTTYQPNTTSCYKYDYEPFVGTIDPTQNVVQPISLLTDDSLAVIEATALAYAGITFTKFITNKNTAIAYDAGVTLIAVNDVVTQTPSGAVGTVKEVIDNGDGTGFLFMINRNAVAFVDNQALQVAAVTKATADLVTFDEDFSWAIDANSLTIQNVNDYHMAKLAMAGPVDAWVAELQERTGRVVFSTGTNFATNNTSSEGAWMYNRGAGTIDFMTADSSVQFVPPITVPILVIVTDETTGSLIDDAMVYMEAGAVGPLAPGTVIISPEITGIDGEVSATISAGGQSFVGLIADATGNAHVAKPISGSIPAEGITLNVSMVSE